MDSEELKGNLTSSKHWLRLLFMVLFAVILYVAAIVMSFLVVLQFLFSLISGRDNRNLREFGQSLAVYIHQTLRFLTYNSEQKPFPFDDWPSIEEPEAAKPRTRAPRSRPASKSKSKARAKTASKAGSKKASSKSAPAAQSSSEAKPSTEAPENKPGPQQ